MYAVLSHIFLHFSAYLTILCSYCTIILYMGRVCFCGPNASVTQDPGGGGGGNSHIVYGPDVALE